MSKAKPLQHGLPRKGHALGMLLTAIGTALLATPGNCGEGLGEGVLSPVGPIGDSERIILIDSLAIMLAIIIPTMITILIFAWWFRTANSRARYLADWSYSGRLELIIWSIPTLVIVFLGGITWISSHELDPAHPLRSRANPLDIQVVAMDWKWLFIYPQQHIASINHLMVPAGVPLHFHITSASVMNVFFVPRLGSQIYAMNGMESNLNLQADKPGNYPGLSGHFSGDGFSGMTFGLHAVSPMQFAAWTAAARLTGPALTDATYRTLLQQSQYVKPYTYHAVQPGLFDAIVLQKLPTGEGPRAERPDSAVKPEQGRN